MQIRIGTGYDVHRLAEGRQLIVGGVKIDHARGAVGHSDADVLIHAICDALLGAANLNDIGYHFSDKDPAYKGIDSRILLRKVVGMLANHGYTIANIDSTVLLQAPRIAPYIPAMKKTLAETAGISETAISIKATTTEHLGFVGREEGIAAQAVALIIPVAGPSKPKSPPRQWQV